MHTAKSYDFIIVGAGSAGCVLANRLSADPANQVLLIEAGKKDRNWLLHIPAGVGKVWFDPKYNWSYSSSPEPFLNDRCLFHPRGKVVGGSSSINMAAYVRGNRRDYDRWAESGLTDWSYERVLPYFKKSETFVSGTSAYRGDKGPMKTALTPTQDPIFDAYVAAGQELGYPSRHDYNAENQEGLALGQFNVFDGRRQCNSVAFLRPALRRRNLDLRTGAMVTRINFDGKKATSIEYELGGKTHSIEARREIIVCAGTYNSAQLLMLSGVGHANSLRDLGIHVHHDAPEVGRNLQDHPSVMIECERRTPSEFQKNLRLDRLTLNMLRALIFRSGPAANPLGFATGFVKTRQSLKQPDIQLFLRLFSLEAHPWFPMIRKPGPTRIGFMACHLQPRSRGQVSLRSNHIDDPPMIVNNFFSTESDLESIRRAFKTIRDLANHESLGTHIGVEAIPGAEVSSDDEIDNYIRETAGTVYHPVGTCRMGVDEKSVVDSELRVRGLDGLRIIDASVMPDLVGGNINAAVTMIAEKGADYILDSNN